MKAGWEIKTFENVLEIKNGRNQKAVQKENGQYPIYGSAGNVMGWADDYICEAGTTIVGRKGTINNPIYTETKFWNVDTAFGLSPKEFLDSKFLHYFCISYDFSEHNRGTTIPSLVKTDLLQIKIPLPPLHEQKRLVTLLDEAFESIATAKANAQQNLKNAHALFESHLQDIFEKRGEGWEDKKLGKIADVQSGGTPLVSEKNYWSGETAWYSSGELNNIYTTDPQRKITQMGLDNSNAKLFPTGSLLIGMYDTAALKMSILDRDAGFNQAIAGVKPNEKIEVEFILHAINANKPRLLLERRGVRQKNLSLEKIKDIAIPLPNLNEQRAVISRIHDVMTETQRLEALYSRKIAALDELKKALLHRAFSGEL